MVLVRFSGQKSLKHGPSRNNIGAKASAELTFRVNSYSLFHKCPLVSGEVVGELISGHKYSESPLLLEERLEHVIAGVPAGQHVLLDSSYRLVELQLNIFQAGVG